MSLKYTSLALQWAIDSENRARIGFSEGRVVFKSGRKQEGLIRMRAALDYAQAEEVNLNEEKLYWGACILSHGKTGEIREALSKIVEGFVGERGVTPALIEEFCKVAISQEYFKSLEQLMEKTRDNEHAFWIATAIKEQLHDSRIVFTLGGSLINVLRRASEAKAASMDERRFFRKMADHIGHLFEKV